ncbi:MAG: hypothetical protein KDL31_04395 [Kiritimatiellae bacterium]|nr:hypothetical protein [Kiritimatiellia bacterium]
MNWLNHLSANASAPLELLMYFVVVVLWLLNQVSQKKKRANRNQSRPAPDQDAPAPPSPFSDFEEEFRELFEGASGREPPPVQVQPPPVVARPPEPRPRRRGQPPMPPSRRMEWASDLTRQDDLSRLSTIAPAADAEMVYHQATTHIGSGSKNLFSDARHDAGFRFPFNSVTMPGTQGSLSFTSGNHDRVGLLRRSDAMDRNRLRQGMAWRQILGPPKALETTPWPDA